MSIALRKIKVDVLGQGDSTPRQIQLTDEYRFDSAGYFGT